ncbi:hypothetical protein KCP70_10505 [Salmonella enterica subsp. enterica]|nr:hypothetical protein KCP70_10505 [Salmonella enterica subsp. enterica]
MSALNGRPHDLGNISAYLGKPTGQRGRISGWLANSFDPSISGRSGVDTRFWDGPMVIKGTSSIRRCPRCGTFRR